MVQGQPVVAVYVMLGCLSRRQLSRWAQKSEALSHARRLIPMLRLAREMKAEGVKPDLTIYNALLACIAQEGLPLEARAVVDDMSAMGVPLDRQSYHHLLHVSSILSEYTVTHPTIGLSMVFGGCHVESRGRDEKARPRTRRTDLRLHHRTGHRNREHRTCPPVHA